MVINPEKASIEINADSEEQVKGMLIVHPKTPSLERERNHKVHEMLETY